MKPVFSLGKDCQESSGSDLSEESDERRAPLLVLHEINEGALCAKIVWHIYTDQVMSDEL